MGKRKKSKVYAYRLAGGEQGIAVTWAECERLVSGRDARYRGFVDRASAQAWLDSGARYEDKSTQKKQAIAELPEDAIFFDAGTGRGRGTEVQVVDREGVPVIYLAGEHEGELTEEGTILLAPERTNNYGELLGCLLALRAAAALGARHVFGDSRLVLEYWSKGRITRDKSANRDLAALVAETTRERRRFEAAGGVISYVPGSINPADLGFHRD